MRHALTNILTFTTLFLFSTTTFAQDGPPQYVRDAIRAVEQLLESQGDAAIGKFIEDAMVPEPGRDEGALILHLQNLRESLAPFMDDIMVEGEPDGVRLILMAGGEERQLKIEVSPSGISGLEISEIEPLEPLKVTRYNLDSLVERMEMEGMAGVLYVKLDGQVIIERGFGMANESLEIPNTTSTIFGTGSRPIDYTRAAIQLLDQRGLLKLDDSIDKYFKNVPADKRAISIRHLMTGQSGLPDFFHSDSDWDPDLAWVDRDEAERRMLAQELLFEPGSGREHSHGAFVLLAALVEHVAGQSYYAFIRTNFLDPAGMTRTGMYGESRNLSLSDFASGRGRMEVGLPNIPPNWGPTSWLIMGSGGMYSTLGDLQRFYSFIRSGKVLDEEHSASFRTAVANLDGSDRGFELFSTFAPGGNEVYLFLNAAGDMRMLQQVFNGLGQLSLPSDN